MRKVWVKPVTGGGVEVRKEENYRKGAFLGNDDSGNEERGPGVEVEVEMEDDGAGMEVEMEKNGFRRDEAVDDDGGGLVVCAVPVEEDSDEEDE